MTSEGTPNIFELTDLCTPWCVHVAATLRVAERLANGAMRIETLAEQCGADASALGRVLRHLAGKGVFAEPEPGRFELNGAAHGLIGPEAQWLDLGGIGGRMAGAWSTLLAAVQTGRPAYHQIFGRPFWEDLQAHPEVAESFDALMGPGHGTPDAEVLPASGWEKVESVVDVGGGTGSLLAEILRAHRGVRGTLVDLPGTVARAQEVFRRAGVSDRVRLVGQSFFEPLPAGADLYLLKNVLADWPDAEAATLLKRCAEAARPRGRVIIVGGVTPEGAEASPELLMLVLVGGKSRSFAEFRELARAAGLQIAASGRQPSGKFVVECRPSVS
ncbi:MAG TPA: methyltransferase [Candidatus Acidoferrales bacterium]|nr:methyltransferase [Candidatus Acidoferrales bacterium]